MFIRSRNFFAQRQHQRGFAAAHRPAHAHGERALAEIPGTSAARASEMPGMLEMFVGMAVRPVMMPCAHKLLPVKFFTRKINFETTANTDGPALLARFQAGAPSARCHPPSTSRNQLNFHRPRSADVLQRLRFHRPHANSQAHRASRVNPRKCEKEKLDAARRSISNAFITTPKTGLR